jgi:hypothetical protein
MFGNSRQGGGGKDQFVRLTGLFQTKKGNWIGRVKVEQFDTLIKLMKDAHGRNGTLNFIISPDKSGKPAMSVVVGDEYKPQGQQAAGGGMFGNAPVPAPQAQFQAQPAPAREVSFGTADVPKDDFDKLLESL